MLGNLFMGHADLRVARALVFVQQESCQPPVEPRKQHLLHGPHDGGEARRGQLVEEAAGVDVLLRQRFHRARADDQKPAVLLGDEMRIKCDLADDAAAVSMRSRRDTGGTA